MSKHTYQLIAINRKSGKETLIGKPDTHGRIVKFKWAQNNRCIYNYYEVREVQ